MKNNDDDEYALLQEAMETIALLPRDIPFEKITRALYACVGCSFHIINTMGKSASWRKWTVDLKNE